MVFSEHNRNRASILACLFFCFFTFISCINLFSLSLTGEIKSENRGIRRELFQNGYVRISELKANFEITGEGWYFISGLSPGTYSLEFLVPGYEKQVKMVSVTHDTRLEDVVLALQVLTIDAVAARYQLNPKQKALMENSARIIDENSLKDYKQNQDNRSTSLYPMDHDKGGNAVVDIRKALRSIIGISR